MRIITGLLVILIGAASALGQQTPPPAAPVFHAGTTLVLVPALVRSKSDEPVFNLRAEDFLLTDDDVPQSLTLEQDTDREPLALAVVVQVGGAGARHLDDYRNLQTTIEALIGDVQHRLAVIRFDSEPRLLANFTSRMNGVGETLHDLEPGDSDAAIYDALHFAVEQLQKQPPEYRRAILLISETVDHGSHTALEDAVRAVSDTNTIIYSFAFSSSKSAAGHEASRMGNDPEPGPPGGCFAKDPNEDPAKHKKGLEKTYECLGLLAPPPRAAKIAALVAMTSMRHNAPETVSQLTGGEYYGFKDKRSLQKAMLTVSNHVPNRYVLSFHPSAPHPGLHTLRLRLKDEPKVEIAARKSYWAQGAAVQDRTARETSGQE
ncbi:MAG: VWFA-related protein [Acidobacteriaceae bacterium]|nr:VWFA-related protein [Acidobacteriaceae bacterium]